MNTLILRSAIISVFMAGSILGLVPSANLRNETVPASPEPTKVSSPLPLASSQPGKIFLPVSRVETRRTPSQPETAATPETKPTIPVAATPTPKPVIRSLVRLEMDADYHSQVTETSVRNACGPTSLLMVLDYYKLEESLERVINQARFSPSQGGFDPTCSKNKVCMSPAGVEKLARDLYGLQADAHENWTLEEVYQVLVTGRPVIADITWRDGASGVGHFVVIYGVDLESQTIYYHDPFDGAARQSSWAEFSASWNGPVDIGDPLKPAGHKSWGVALAKPK